MILFEKNVFLIATHISVVARWRLSFLLSTHKQKSQFAWLKNQELSKANQNKK